MSESIAGNGLIADDGQITFPFTRHDPSTGDLPILERWVLGWYSWELTEWCVVKMHKRGDDEFWVERGGFPVDMPTYWFDLPNVI